MRLSLGMKSVYVCRLRPINNPPLPRSRSLAGLAPSLSRGLESFRQSPIDAAHLGRSVGWWVGEKDRAPGCWKQSRVILEREKE